MMVFAAIHEYFERNGDPRIKPYLFMDSIWKPVMITAAYLLISMRIGPWLMKNRKPFNVKKYIMAYNVLQVALNLYLTVMCIHAYSKVKITSCIELDFSNSERGYREIHCAQVYFLLKILDVMDTIFFLLKKSYRQMSFLHIYHHAAMIMVTWFAVKYYPGGQSGWACVFNTIVHVFMYSYYFASAYDVKYKHNIPMKKLMTQLQLLQFFLLLYFYGYSLVSSCKFSKLLSLLGVSQAVIFIYLFSDFYYHAYIKPKKDEKLNHHD